MEQSNGNVTAKEFWAVMKYLFLKRNRPTIFHNEIRLYRVTGAFPTPVKSWVAGFITGHLSTADENVLGDFGVATRFLWSQLSTVYVKTGTETSVQNVVF
jgi:hypothetical protein